MPRVKCSQGWNKRFLISVQVLIIIVAMCRYAFSILLGTLTRTTERHNIQVLKYDVQENRLQKEIE